MPNNNDTIFALSTPFQKSALCVFRVSGIKSHNKIKEIVNCKKLKLNEPNLCYLIDKNKNKIDKVITTFYKSPKTYTGEDLVEISCHGSLAVIKKVSETILNKKIRLAEPGEFTKRALLNEKLNILEAESINELINSETENQRKIAINTMEGRLEKKLNSILDKVSKLLADVEAIIDFADEDLPKEMLRKTREQKKNIIKLITKTIEKSEISKKIFSGYRVSILGKPNTGKSSFINYISNKNISIVTKIPGTTRDLVSSVLEINGNKFTFVDTAGIRKSRNKIEQLGVEKSIQSARDSDINLVFLENKEIKKYDDFNNKIFVRSKSDLKKKSFKGAINISSKTGSGIKNLLKNINKKIPPYSTNTQYFSRERHIKSLKNSLYLIENIDLASLDTASEDLRRCYMELKQINQNFDIEKILDIIFSDFCIGK